MPAHGRRSRSSRPTRIALACAFACALAAAALTPPRARAQQPAPPAQPVSAPRGGPIENVFRTFNSKLSQFAMIDGKRAAAQADSAMRAAYAAGDLKLAIAYRFFRDRQWVREVNIPAGLADFESVLVVARQMKDTVMVARVWSSRGHGNQLLGRYEESKKAFRQAIRWCKATQSYSLEGFCHRGLGWILKSEGKLDEARGHFELAIVQVAPTSQEYLTSRTMLAEIKNRLGHYDEAREEFEAVRDEARKRKDPYSEVAAVWDLANQAYTNGDLAAADRNWAYAGAIYDSLEDFRAMVVVQTNRAQALVHQDRQDEALALLDRLLERARTFENPSPRIAVQNVQGQVLRRMGRTAQAERLLRGVRSETDGRDELEHDLATCELATLLTESGRAAEAEAALDSMLAPSRAVEISVPDRAYAWIGKSRARRAQGRPASALAAARQAEKLARVGRKDGSYDWLDASIELGSALREAGRPDSAMAVFANASRVWERLRSQISSLEWRERYGAGLSGMFAAYGAAALDSRRAAPPATRARQAFDALQAFQARTLEERMHGAGISARAMARRASADSLCRRVLRPGETLVDFVATPETTLVFALSTRGVESYGVAGTDRLRRRFEDWRSAMLGGAPSATVESGLKSLSAELLGPLAPTLRTSRRVIVSGGGDFMLWPIAALTLPGEAAPLGAVREVVSTPSATLFALMRARAVRGAAAPALLAVGRTTTADGREMPGAERELRELGAGYSGVTVRENRGDRTLAQLTGDLGKWDALHFAAHSETPESAPWRSGFLLGKGAADDAYFRAAAVARMKLKARVAVLSGCSSAGATSLAGEGALGRGIL